MKSPAPVKPNSLQGTSLIKKPRRTMLPVVSKDALVRMIDKIRRSRVSTFARRPVFLHPWSVVSSWLPKDSAISSTLRVATFDDDKAAANDDDGSWHFQVMPGFVNGTPVRISTIAANASEETLIRIEKERDADPNATQKGRPSGNDGVDVPLTEFPYLAITDADLRPVGYGAISIAGDLGSQDEAVPQTFIAMGVKDSVTKLTISLSGGIKISEGEPVDLKTTRLLRACDLVLKVERASLKFDIQKGNPFLDGYTQIVTPRYARNSKTRKYATLFTTENAFIPPKELEGDDLLSALPADEEYDYQKIATIYFVSPFETDPTAKINKHWQVVVKYSVFWNLCHMPAAIPPMLPPDPIRFITPLGFGMAQTFINTILAPINDATSRFMATLRAKRQNGVFWST